MKHNLFDELICLGEFIITEELYVQKWSGFRSSDYVNGPNWHRSTPGGFVSTNRDWGSGDIVKTSNYVNGYYISDNSTYNRYIDLGSSSS